MLQFQWFFLITIIIVMWCLGWRGVTDTGKLLGFLRKPFEKNTPAWSKPVLMCVWCMPSFWGTIIYWNLAVVSKVVYELTIYQLLLYWILSIVSASFWSGYMWTKVEHLKAQLKAWQS